MGFSCYEFGIRWVCVWLAIAYNTEKICNLAMPQPILRSSEAGIGKATRALRDKGWSRQDLADYVVVEGKKPQTGINIQTVNSFFTCKDIKSQFFVGICKTLELHWPDIAKPDEEPNINYNNPFIPQHGKIDDPRFLFGREREIRRVFETLNGGSSVAIVGERAIGKSSLLQAIYQEAPNQLRPQRQPIYLKIGRAHV